MSTPTWKTAEARRVKQRLAAGLCMKCGKEPVVNGLKQGQNCLDKAKDWKKKNKARITGKCEQCGKPSRPEKVYCAECALKLRTKYKQRVERGLCVFCDRPPVSGIKTCDSCRKRRDRCRRKRSTRLRNLILTSYGGKCVCCGETTPEFLHIDHIFNDGGKHRREIKKAGTAIYKWLQEQGFPKDRFQLLCANCNLAKGFYGECPHHKNRVIDESIPLANNLGSGI